MQYIKKKSPELVESAQIKNQTSTSSEKQQPSQTYKPSYSATTKSYKELKTDVAPKQEEPKAVVQEPIKTTVEIKNNNFSQEDLEHAWDMFRKSIVDDVQLCAIVKELQPQKKELEIWFELVASTQKNCFEQIIKPKAIVFLRQELGNDSILIQITFKKEESIENRPSNNSEKFDYLLKQNPYLQNMKDELDLEIE